MLHKLRMICEENCVVLCFLLVLKGRVSNSFMQYAGGIQSSS